MWSQDLVPGRCFTDAWGVTAGLALRSGLLSAGRPVSPRWSGCIDALCPIRHQLCIEIVLIPLQRDPGRKQPGCSSDCPGTSGLCSPGTYWVPQGWQHLWLSPLPVEKLCFFLPWILGIWRFLCLLRACSSFFFLLVLLIAAWTRLRSQKEWCGS